MSQAIENSTDLVTRIVGGAGSSSIPGFDLVTVDVLAAQPVEGKADVLSSLVGERLDVSVPRGRLTADDLTGYSLELRASMVGPGVIRAEPTTPGATDFQVQPPIEA